MDSRHETRRVPDAPKVGVWARAAWQVGSRAAVLALLAAVAVACGESVATTAQPGASPAARDGQRLWIKQGGQLLAFENGRTVTIDGVGVELSVTPYPVGRSASIALYVTRDGAPLDGATVTLHYDMTLMQHGPFQLLAAPTGHGRYLAPLDLPMAGEFWLDLAVQAPGSEALIRMVGQAAR
jgi:hypothetical protein